MKLLKAFIIGILPISIIIIIFRLNNNNTNPIFLDDVFRYFENKNLFTGIEESINKLDNLNKYIVSEFEGMTMAFEGITDIGSFFNAIGTFFEFMFGTAFNVAVQIIDFIASLITDAVNDIMTIINFFQYILEI